MRDMADQEKGVGERLSVFGVGVSLPPQFYCVFTSATLRYCWEWPATVG